MNQGGPQGQGQMPPNQGNGQSQPNAANQQRITMFKPENMRTLPGLTPEDRKKYEHGLSNLWSVYNSKPEGSQEWVTARARIVDFSNMLATRFKEQRRQAQQQSQGGPPPNGQNAMKQEQVGGSQSAPASRPSTAGQQGQAPASASTPAQQAGRPAGPMAATPYSQKIREHLTAMPFNPPPEMGPEDARKWQAVMRNKYAQALTAMYHGTEQTRKLDAFRADRIAKGTPLSEQEMIQWQLKKDQSVKQHQEGKAWAEQFRNSQMGPDRLKNGNTGANPEGQARPQSNGGIPNANANQPARPGPSPQQPSQGNGQNNASNAANAAIDTKNQQAAAGNRLPAANGQGGQQQAQPVFQAMQAPQGAATSAAPQASPIAASPAPTTQNIKLEPDTQPQQQPPAHQQAHPHPPPVNTAIASAAAAGLQSAGTPTQNRVITPTTAGATRSLSHQAAVTLANQQQRASQPGSAAPGQPTPQQQQQQQQPQPQQHQQQQQAQQQQQQQQSTPQGPGGTPSGVPSVMGTVQQQQGHSHAHPSQQAQPLTSKLPIPKNLPDKATMAPQAVAMGGGVQPGRPTMTGGSGIAGGVMGQPVIAKPPPIQLEGEGERVLNRKKLDELVRQVCGGQAEGAEGNLLTPDVEEAVLNVADSFVDNVLAAACRHAKERGSKVLEIRDIQLVLERVYNMRIPGYSSDELRTVRKIQPASGWITKMSAIQAAKVMPGKGDL